MIQATRVSHCQIDAIFTFADAIAHCDQILLICAHLLQVHIEQLFGEPYWFKMNEETGCSLHVTNRFPMEPENPCGPVVAPSSAWNRWRQSSSLIWSRHTSHCRGCPKLSSSRRITPAVSRVNICAVTSDYVYVLCHRIPLFQTNDWVMSLLERDGGVEWLKYVEPGSAMMLMCSSVMVFLWYFLSMPRTCVKIWSLRPSKNTPWMPVYSNWS